MGVARDLHRRCIYFFIKMAEGVGMLLFEVCKGVQRQFHSCSERVNK